MKKIIPLLYAAFLAAVPSLFAADFEGKVTMKLSGARELPPSLTYSIKGTATRIDLTAPGEAGRVAMLTDSTKQEMVILMLDQKMFMTQPIPKVSGASVAAAGSLPESTLEKTAVTEKILGYDCVKYTSKSKSGTTELWVTEQLGSFSGLGGGNPLTGGLSGGRGSASANASASAWEKALAGLNAFPLRVVSTEGGKESFRMEATAVDRQTIPSAAFVAPTDFQDLSAMMRGMALPPGMKLPGGN
jgi:hypothetical protein